MDESPRFNQMTDASAALRASLDGIGRGFGSIVALFHDVVGPGLAQVATPTSLRDGTLTIRCTSASWAQAIGLREHDLLARFSEQLGPGTITRIHARAGLGSTPPAPAPPPPLPPVRETDSRALEALVAEIPDAALRARVLAAAEATARRRSLRQNP